MNFSYPDCYCVVVKPSLWVMFCNLAGTEVGSVPQVGTGSTLLPYWAEGSHGMNVEANGYQLSI